MKKAIMLCLFVFLLVNGLTAQVNVAVSAFLNESDDALLDAWERRVPSLMRAHLSDNPDVLIVEREQLEEILQEQALSLSGLADSSRLQSIGKLVGAEFILLGKVDHQENEYIITADLVRVKTGQVQTEIVRSSKREYVRPMVEMLAANILYRLTGEGEYRNQKIFKSDAVWYWLGSTVLLSSAALVTHDYHQKYQRKYDQATQLKDFDKFYDTANNSRYAYQALGLFAGSAAIGTLVSWLNGDDENAIYSGRSQAQQKIDVFIVGTHDIQIGMRVSF